MVIYTLQVLIPLDDCFIWPFLLTNLSLTAQKKFSFVFFFRRFGCQVVFAVLLPQEVLFFGDCFLCKGGGINLEVSLRVYLRGGGSVLLHLIWFNLSKPSKTGVLIIFIPKTFVKSDVLRIMERFLIDSKRKSKTNARLSAKRGFAKWYEGAKKPENHNSSRNRYFCVRY